MAKSTKLYIENRMVFPVYVLLCAEHGELNIHVHAQPYSNATEIGPDKVTTFEADEAMRSCYDSNNGLDYTVHPHGMTIMFVGGAERQADGPIFSIRDPQD